MKRIIWMAMLSLGFLLIVACGGGSGGGGGAFSGPQLKVSLADATTTDYKAVYVTVGEIAVQKEGSTDWTVLSSTPQTCDLLKLVNGVREELALSGIESGHYSQLRLILADTPDDSLNINSVKHPYANYFIDQADNSIELKVPSGLQTGIKIVQGFDVSEAGTTELILDFDAMRSIVRAGKSGQWLLKPTIKILTTAEYSIIQGTADMEGVLISAQVYDAAAADPADRVQVAAATVSDASGNYALFLKPGTYTLVGYKDGYVTFFKDAKVVTVTGGTVTEDFSMGSAADTGTLKASASISGATNEQYATFSIRQKVTVDSTDEWIEVKTVNVANGGSFETSLPVLEDYKTAVSTYGKSTVEKTFSITKDTINNIGNVSF